MKICDRCDAKRSEDFEVSTERLCLYEMGDDGTLVELTSKTSELCPNCHEILFELIDGMWATFLDKEASDG